MRPRKYLAILMASTTAALAMINLANAAAPEATDARAADIQQAVELYIGKGVPPIFTVVPAKTHYAFTLDPTFLTSRLKAADLTISPITGTITPAGPGKWDYAYSGNVDAKFKRPAPLSLTLAPTPSPSETVVHYEGLDAFGTFDSSSMASTTEKIRIDRIKISAIQPTLNPLATIRHDNIENKIEITLNSTPHDATSLDQHIVSITESSSGSVETPPLAPITYTTGRSATTLDVSQLRSRAIFALWAWISAHPTADQAIASQDELRPLLRSILPLLETFKISNELLNPSLSFNKAKVSATKGVFEAELSKLSGPATFNISTSVNGISYADVELAPTWAAPLIPTDYSFGLEIAGFNPTAYLETIVDHFDLTKKEPLSPAVIAAAAQTLLPPTGITVKPQAISIKSRIYQISIDGSITSTASGKPVGDLTIRAKGLNAILAVLAQPASVDPKIGQISTQITMVKNMAKQLPNDESLWIIGFTADGHITLNGAVIAAIPQKPGAPGDNHL